MVGDSLENDVRGAIAAGFVRAVWLPHGRQGTPPPGAVTARALTEVPALLGLE
jgi:FMN phosphatase YigB (HAD superfamily)